MKEFLKNTDPLKTFLLTEFFLLSKMGAFLRGNVYNELGKNANKNKKDSFLEYVFGQLKIASEKYQDKKYSSKEHARCIEQLANKISASQYKELLLDGRFRIGTAQKILNLYLKYLWCAGEITEPPHCPFDRNIYEILQIRNTIPCWTKLDKIGDYEKLVEKASMESSKTNETLANWENRVWLEWKKREGAKVN